MGESTCGESRFGGQAKAPLTVLAQSVGLRMCYFGAEVCQSVNN